MAKLYPLISSFSAGELSPLVHVRTDLEAAYRNGAAIMENFIADSHGPVERRGGTEQIAIIPASFGRAFGFEVRRATNFIAVAANDGLLYITDPGGIALDAAAFIVTNPDFDASPPSTGWTVETTGGGANVVFSPGACNLSPGDATAAIRQQLTTTDGALEHSLSVLVSGPNAKLNINIGTAAGLGDILAVSVVDLTKLDLAFTPGAGNEIFWIEVEADTAPVILDRVRVLDASLATTEITFAHPWATDGEIRDLQVAQPSGDFSMYFCTPERPVQKLSYDLSTGVWTFAAVAFGTPPTQWTATNNPGAITFFQNRMWLAATPNEPETFWGSKVNSYEDFDKGTAADDDAVEFQLNFRGRIEWMAGVKNLLIGTENSEYIVTADTGVIKAGDIQVESQSSFTSSGVQPAAIGNNVMYVTADGRKVRDIGFRWTDEQWVSRDITFMSEHITEGADRITDIAWVQNPDNLLWCATRAGNLVCATYEKGYDVIGWHRHNTEGRIMSIAKVEAFGASQLWLLVDRGVTTDEIYLEAFRPDVHIDDHAQIFNDPAINTVSVPHLANKTVTVLTDGAVHPNITLDGNGDGTLNNDYTNVIIGLPFVSTLQTLSLDSISTTGGGALRSRQERWARIFVSLVNSHKPIINGVRPPERHPQTPMDTKEPPATEYVRVADLGHDRDAFVTVVQDLPLSCVINGIFGEAAEGRL